MRTLTHRQSTHLIVPNHYKTLGLILFAIESIGSPKVYPGMSKAEAESALQTCINIIWPAYARRDLLGDEAVIPMEDGQHVLNTMRHFVALGLADKPDSDKTNTQASNVHAMSDLSGGTSSREMMHAHPGDLLHRDLPHLSRVLDSAIGRAGPGLGFVSRVHANDYGAWPACLPAQTTLVRVSRKPIVPYILQQHGSVYSLVLISKSPHQPRPGPDHALL